MTFRNAVLIAGAFLVLLAIILMLTSVIFQLSISPVLVSLSMIGGVALIIIHHGIAMDEH